jgi:signal peptidase II
MKKRTVDGGESNAERVSNPQSAIHNPQSFGWRAAYLLAAFGVYLVDQTSKAWALRHLRLGQDVTLVPRFLDLAYAENPGVAFGQLQEGGATGRWLLVALACAATVAVLTYFFRTPRHDDRILGACALLLAGITGNVTDRIRLGHVIDFILLHADTHYWPTFNVADASICAGACLLALDLILDSRRRKSRIASQNAEARTSQ